MRQAIVNHLIRNNIFALIRLYHIETHPKIILEMYFSAFSRRTVHISLHTMVRKKKQQQNVCITEDEIYIEAISL